MQQSSIIQSLDRDECFPADYFENQDLEALMCPIGLGIVNNPVFDPCGHVFCRSCIQKWLDKSPICPVNNSPLTKQQLTTALPVRNLILNLNLKQCFNHCDWKGRLELYDKHVQNDCPQAFINCVNVGCDQKIKRLNTQNHMDECLFKQIHCDHCGLKFQENQILHHIEKCEERLNECQGCQKQVKEGQMIQHQQFDCEARLIQCQINGCQHKDTTRRMEHHLEQNKDHIILLQKQIMLLTEQVNEQGKLNQDLNIRLDQQKQIPFFQGYKLSFSKKEQSREWNSINSMHNIGSYFRVKFEITGLQARSNSWRSVVGISSKKLSQYLWYKSENTFVWIMGGFKCQGNMSPEPYGTQVEGDFTVTMTLNRNCELMFQKNFEDFGPAFKIEKEVVDGGFYILLSLINAGKFRIIEYSPL